MASLEIPLMIRHYVEVEFWSMILVAIVDSHYGTVWFTLYERNNHIGGKEESLLEKKLKHGGYNHSKCRGTVSEPI